MTPEPAIDAFLVRWLGQPGGAEQSNAQLFLAELCTLLDLPAPEPASSGRGDYVFERAVKRRPSEGGGLYGRIDLYRRDSFVLEAKQSRLQQSCTSQTDAAPPQAGGRGLRGRGWDRLMHDARGQAEGYVDRLPTDHAAPPFLIICDVGHVLEIYADFSGTGRDYTYFPDRQGFRIFLEDLRREDIRDRLRKIWLEPHALDPTRRRARVTRGIAMELAEVSRRLEKNGCDPEVVAVFLMRCVFSLFAASVGLLPYAGLLELLDRCIDRPEKFLILMEDVWIRMNDPIWEGRYTAVLDTHVPYVGGRLFQNATVLRLDAAALQALRRAAQHSWADVEPAVFGALLENALEPEERRRLGAHYTPRPYVERLVRMTIMEPLRHEWYKARAMIERARDRGRDDLAKRRARTFHTKLRNLRVLDPACGTGNFLYIALEAIKRLEAEVLELLAQLGEPELLAFETIDPRQFYGLEANIRAAVIAELVLWLGFLQLHYREHTGHPSEPILRDYETIRHADALLSWTDWPNAQFRGGREVSPTAVRSEWPEADFIIGNPPFLGGKDLRTELGALYVEALWRAYPQMNRSADLVMYWWDHAAGLLTKPAARLRRFGFVTTNSLTQTFQRRVVTRWLKAEAPVRLTHAVADHPWIEGVKGAAAVRVSMSVAEAGVGAGLKLEIVSEERDPTASTPRLTFCRRRGVINSDLTIGPDLASVRPLLANRGLCSPGVKLHGAGFIVSPETARELGLGRRAGLETYIRPYRNGRDLMQHGRDALVIDLYPLPADEVRARFPEVYQHLQATVKPHRILNRMAFRRETWWWFGATHELYRSFTADLPRYICTPETAKHRVFTFLPAGVRADNMVVAFGSDDAFHLGVLSSAVHRGWAAAVGAVLEDRPRYTKSLCFDPFPFPDPPTPLRSEIASIAEDLWRTRETVLSEAPDLTLTGLYNLMAEGSDGDAARRGRAGILRELHGRLDAAVARAYGWSTDLARDDLLSAIVELNAGRRREEQDGRVRWLRPEYQAPRFATPTRRVVSETVSRRTGPLEDDRPPFPRDVDEQSGAVLESLSRSPLPLDPEALARTFRRGGRRIEESVRDALLLLMQYGHVSLLPDGRYTLRRAA